MSFRQRRRNGLFRVSWGTCLLLSVLAHLFLLAGSCLVPEEWLASDVHEGRTGVENKDNIYRLELKKYRTNLDSYILKAEVSGVSQGASKGEMVLKKLVD